MTRTAADTSPERVAEKRPAPRRTDWRVCPICKVGLVRAALNERGDDA